MVIFCLFRDTAPTEIYTLSLHDALPISRVCRPGDRSDSLLRTETTRQLVGPQLSMAVAWRSEEHTSELQSLTNLVCRLLLEKKNQSAKQNTLNHVMRDAGPPTPTASRYR